MSIITEVTAEHIPSRSVQIMIDKPYKGTPSMRVMHESITTLPDGVVLKRGVGMKTVKYNETNPLHIALFTAMQAVVDSL